MVQSFTTPPIDAQISQYELAIEQDPTINDNYWQLGICFLLQGNEEAAQSTWFFPMANAADNDEVYNLAQELGSAIATTARQQTKLQNFEAALLLRQHLQEVDNGQLENILEIILLSAGGGHLIPELVTELRLAEVLAETAGAAAVAEESLTIYQPYSLPPLATCSLC